MIYVLASIGFAYLLNRIIGDFPIIPKTPEMQVRFVAFLERHFYDSAKTSKTQTAQGTIALCLGIAVSFFLPVIFIFSLYYVYRGADWIAHTVLCCQLLGMHAIRKGADDIFKGIHFEDVDAARTGFTKLTGLDATSLDNTALIRETVLHISDQSLVSVVAPLFFMCIGGAPLAFLYAFVNTAAARAARMPDRHAFYKSVLFLHKWLLAVPARCCGAFMIYAAYLCRLDAKRAIAVLRRDHALRFNEGYAEAPVAGAIGLQLGGPRRFGSLFLERPPIGDDARDPADMQIKEAKDMMYAVSICAWLVFLILSWLCFVH